jgi:hypothetical protein
MNLPAPKNSHSAPSENQFTACNSMPRMLEKKLSTAWRRADGGEFFAPTILFASWSISTNPEQRGLFFGIIGACVAQSLVVLKPRDHKIGGLISLMNDKLDKLVTEK